MGLFKSKEEKELDYIIQRLEMNMSNNYKDNARDNLDEFEEVFDAMRSSGKAKPAVIAKYEALLQSYQERMKGYSHKDQKPYWN